MGRAKLANRNEKSIQWSLTKPGITGLTAHPNPDPSEHDVRRGAQSCRGRRIWSDGAARTPCGLSTLDSPAWYVEMAARITSKFDFSRFGAE
jgi:hypothetical protein